MESIDAVTPDARTLELERPEGTAPVKLVLAVEGLDTSDGRFINVGALDTRPMPLTIWAQVRSTHGIEGDAATFVVGSITEAERVPGPDVLQRSTGEPFPPDTAVWLGRGWMYTDVPSPESGSKPAYTLMKDGALYGNSVDLVAVDAEFVYGENDPLDGPPRQIVTHSASIASTTLVGIPAFQDAFVEVDGEPITPSTEALALVAAGPAIPSWRSAEIGDKCGPCLAAPAEEHFVPEAVAHSVAVLEEALAEQGLAEPEPFADVLTGEDLEPAALDFSTSGMVALIPAEPGLLAVPAGDRPDELHLTLAYLGEEVTTWRPEEIAAVHAVARSATDAQEQCRQATERALEANEEPPECEHLYVSPAQEGPLGLNVFAHAQFNPNGGPAGQKPATVYLFDGSGHASTVTALAEQIANELSRQVGAAQFPEQHRPFIPHVTAGYNLDPNQLTYTGPVTFDRIRVAIGNQRTDYPLGGGSAIVAAAAPLPPAAWFEDPKLEGPTPATVTEDGRVFGHLATWGTCHVTFPGQCITPPRSPSGYAYFLVHSTRALDAAGNTVEVPVGYGTLSRDSAGGHAAVTLSATEAARHYDNTCTAVYEINVGEDDHGIWFAGRLMPGLDEFTEHKARGVAFSGDWRPIRGRRELVAALGVNTPGFPVPRVRVVGGQPAALVAAGVPLAEPASAEPEGAVAQLAAWVAEQRDTAERERMEWAYALTSAELTIALEGDHPWFAATETAEMLESLGALLGEEYAGKKLHLPPFIKRIEKHLRAKGMSESHAIATAVNAAKKMCSTGDLNFPGSQQVNPGSKAEACRAVAQWKKDRPGAR